MQRRALLYHVTPRLVFGDFNDITSNDEKAGGRLRSESSFEAFRSMIASNRLHDLQTIGGNFTWVGSRHAYVVRSKIDRAMVNTLWSDLFPSAYTQLLTWMGFDHRPLLLGRSDVNIFLHISLVKLLLTVEMLLHGGNALPIPIPVNRLMS
ncbi:unnamed protein product [Thlaspi arvense]|uniref:Endonuclease/exonuclease/phosphatase domain-containing protein n=1 Tax=Thlaspi arvense TaxID=13288 RepID=A0AAU9RNQ4_THLAR|nr:unnamed protein product [Thlaspi arvense]